VAWTLCIATGQVTSIENSGVVVRSLISIVGTYLALIFNKLHGKQFESSEVGKAMIVVVTNAIMATRRVGCDRWMWQ